MSDGRGLVSAMMKAGKPKQNEIVDLVLGKVTSISPLKVKVDKIELTESFLIVGALCKYTSVKVPTPSQNTHIHKIPEHETETGGQDAHTHSIIELDTLSALPDILLWRGLSVGDEVYMIKYSLGQKYYIIQRKEGIA